LRDSREDKEKFRRRVLNKLFCARPLWGGHR
jgi:hypothetical protein